jgi:hypothetical protein
MANTPVVVLDDTMTSIANAIRSKTGGSATMTPGQMPAQIASIPSGGSFIGIPRALDQNGKMIYSSGVYSLPSSVKDVGEDGMKYSNQYNRGITSVNLSGLEKISGPSAFYYAFHSCSNLTSVNLANVTQIGEESLEQAFRDCTNLTTVDFSSLQAMTGSKSLYFTFMNCTSLVTVTFPALTRVSQDGLSYAFRGCTSLTTLSFPELEEIRTGPSDIFNNFINGCTNLTALNLPKLKKVSSSYALRYMLTGSSIPSVTFPMLTNIDASYVMNGMARGRQNLTLYFPALTTSSFGNNTNQFNDMFATGSDNTVHFPAAIQSTIENWRDVQNGFGGTNTTVLFDL